jgi:small GTP-binding protein
VRVIATAGHVDHGKSSLVLALTGTDPDRFAEEKRRGLTIDLGFAHTVVDGEAISFVDVPGHVRFLRNMLAGVGGVDCCLFVVAATEGWKPQSEEHMRILELVGVTHGIIALTKVDLLDDAELVELAALEVAERTAGTFLGGAPIVPVAAPSGRGLPALRTALATLARTTPAAADHGRPRMWIDRVFAAKGSGTVVTGTLTDGSITTGDHVRLEPGGHGARVRAIQTLGRTVGEIGPGNRVALNLAGVEHGALTRGDAVVAPHRWHTTATVDATLDVLASLAHPVSRRGAHLAYIGSGEHAVRVRVLGPQAIEPGGRGLVRLHLAAPLPLLPGDRYVLRETGRDETVGGGELLDVAPVRPASSPSAAGSTPTSWSGSPARPGRPPSVAGSPTLTPSPAPRPRCGPASTLGCRLPRSTGASGPCSPRSPTSSSSAGRPGCATSSTRSSATPPSTPSPPAAWRPIRRKVSTAPSFASWAAEAWPSSAMGCGGTPAPSRRRRRSPPTSCAPIRTGSPSASSAKPRGSPASTRCRCWPSSTAAGSPAGEPICGSPGTCSPRTDQIRVIRMIRPTPAGSGAPPG